MNAQVMYMLVGVLVEVVGVVSNVEKDTEMSCRSLVYFSVWFGYKRGWLEVRHNIEYLHTAIYIERTVERRGASVDARQERATVGFVADSMRAELDKLGGLAALSAESRQAVRQNVAMRFLESSEVCMFQ